MSSFAPYFTDRIPLPPRSPFLISSEHKVCNVIPVTTQLIVIVKLFLKRTKLAENYITLPCLSKSGAKRKGKKSLLKLDKRSTRARSRNPRNSHYSDLPILIQTNLLLLLSITRVGCVSLIQNNRRASRWKVSIDFTRFCRI